MLLADCYYAECHLECHMMSGAIKYIVLSVILLNVILISVIGTILFAFSLFKSWIDVADMFKFFARVRLI